MKQWKEMTERKRRNFHSLEIGFGFEAMIYEMQNFSGTEWHWYLNAEVRNPAVGGPNIFQIMEERMSGARTLEDAQADAIVRVGQRVAGIWETFENGVGKKPSEVGGVMISEEDAEIMRRVEGIL